MEKVLVVGMGHVGRALAEIIEGCSKYDLQTTDITHKEIVRPIDVMHICFPYSNQFDRDVTRYIDWYEPKLTLIESTVKPNTTQKIFHKTGVNLCHSPVRGNHSEGLVKGLRTYTKFIGPIRYQDGLLAEEYYNSLGLSTVICSSPLETEFMKLLETSYSALMIAYFQEIRRLCDKFGVNEAEIKHFFLTNTLESNFKHMRPVCYPSLIGGHCLLDNLAILNKTYPMKLVAAIVESNNRRAAPSDQ